LIKVLALVSKRPGLSPGQRYRIEQWVPYLRSAGIEVDLDVFESESLTDLLYQRGHVFKKTMLLARDFLERRRVLFRAARYDVIFLYREAAIVGPSLYEQLLARTKIPIIYDFDDAIWLAAPGSNNGLFSHLRFPSKTATNCRMASVVTVGNRFLADYARGFNNRVEIIPTTIELGSYPRLPEPAFRDPFVIGWTGSFSTLIHLELARGPIERLARERSVRMRVVCSEPPARPFAGVDLEFVPWSSAREAEDVAGCHVGIMPLPDDAFARGKCACKALQFMAVGRPVVASPVGINQDVIQSGKNGLLARTEDEWYQALVHLADSPRDRASLGDAARQTVEEGYAAHQAATRLADIVKSVVTAAHQRGDTARA
jgi:glycosyltransferase involved in cell wall biosynthesis